MEGAQLQSNLVANPAPLEDFLPRTASDYGKFINFPTLQGKQLNNVNENVERMLTQLDEFTALVDTIRANMDTTQSVIPQLMSQTKQLEKTFAYIDGVEGLLQMLNLTIDQLESKIAQAESNNSTFKKVFSSLPGRSKKQNASQQLGEGENANPSETKAEAISIVDTQQYFNNLRQKITHQQ